MSYYLIILICLVVGYLFGSIPMGYLYCSHYNVDILNEGSKSPGYTNVKRVMGKKHGRVVFILDILKVIIPIVILALLNKYFNIFNNQNTILIDKIISVYVGVGAVIGHNFPLFLRFRGGKGIACTFAFVLMFNPFYAIVLFLIYKIVSFITNIVSIGSIIAEICLFILSLLLSIKFIYPFNFYNSLILIPGFFIVMLLTIYAHRENIKRILNGTENKIKMR